MPSPIRPRARVITALTGAAALAATAISGVAPASGATGGRTVTIAGSLQSELGCSADWQPDCTATDLRQEGDTSIYSRVFEVPAGSYELKAVINHSWDENYGVGGAANGANIPLALQGTARVRISYDDATHRVSIEPLGLKGATDANDTRMAASSLRKPLTKERFYFLMADRFANGDTANDRGGLTGGRLETGYDPTDKGFYHGGDLKGVISKLDYIKGMGTTAIWLTPSFKNRPVQGTPGNESAGYHGYWITDFTQIDPHLGTNEDMKTLIDQAHAKGMKVFFDIITNHTADVIDYREGQYVYRNKTDYPYKDASGTVFDDRTYAGTSTFPPLDPKVSFPYTPFFHNAADAHVKVPAWLNDRTLYHNRGDSTFAGESSTYGDFVGLDDLFTEQPKVVDGMTKIYQAWTELGIDGFRIDTVKHVNMEFWQKFSPAVMQHAHAVGTKNFFMFGEVYDAKPQVMSQYTTTAKLPATLDFGFQQEAVNFVGGKAGTPLRDLYANDDYYTDSDSNAYQLPTFLGNHDMGRVAMFLRDNGASGSELMRRTQLANELMYLTRGQPVVYYGDEQGFMGSGGDKDARQDMFATKVQQYADEAVLGGPSGSMDRYNAYAPIYQQLRELAKLRQTYPALADGAQVHRYASSGAGIFAVSRVKNNQEFVVAVNNATTRQSATITTYKRNGRLDDVRGPAGDLSTDRYGRARISLPPLTAQVWRVSNGMSAPTAAPTVRLASPAPGAVVGDRAEIRAEVGSSAFNQVSFYVRPVGTQGWTRLGTDDNAPYRVFHDVTGYPTGTLLEYRAVTRDSAGQVAATSSYGTVGTPAPEGDSGDGVGPVTQPDAVSAPGSHNTEMGCAADWAPDCAQAQLSLDARDRIWKTSATIPAGEYAYKAAINRSWDENYGAGGVRNGDNISYTSTGGVVNFYYDHATHYMTSDRQGPILTAPGTFQDELGCGQDDDPTCMRPWLQDKEGDGTYTWSTAQVPAGTYTFAVNEGLGQGPTYGADGSVGGAPATVTVPSDGMVMTITYDAATHRFAATVRQAAVTPDLTTAKAEWLSSSLVVLPRTSVPEGSDPASMRYTLHWGQPGTLAVDAEDVTGGRSTVLRYEPTMPSWALRAHPELKDYLALKPDAATAQKVAYISSVQDAVAVNDSLGRLVDATGIDPSWCGICTR